MHTYLNLIVLYLLLKYKVTIKFGIGIRVIRNYDS